MKKKGQEVLGSSEWVQEKPTGGAGWVVGSSSLVDVGLAKGFMRPIGLKIKEAHPHFLFGRLFSPRVPLKTDVGATRMEPMVLADKDFTAKGSFPSRPTLTDKALMEKVSRYPVSHSHSFLSLGFQGDSSFILFLGPDKALLVLKGASSGSESSVAVTMDWDPL